MGRASGRGGRRGQGRRRRRDTAGPRTLAELGEEALVELLARRFPASGTRVVRGIGDDTSVTTQKAGRLLLATTDTLVEGTHFTGTGADAFRLGRKALSVSVSDVAAMGGVPLFFLVSLTAPPSTGTSFIDDLYRGLEDAATEYEVELAGGNTTRGATLEITTTLMGEVERNRVVYRNGARPGDLIYVTGTPGDSALGLLTLREKGPSAATRGPYKKAVLRHLDPRARMEAGRALAVRRLVTAMIDVSDGVALDLKRLSEASSAENENKVGVVIHADALHLSADMKRFAKLNGEGGRRKALELALSGGEDYELLFTVRPSRARRAEALSAELGLAMTRIGEVTERAEGVKVLDGVGGEVKVERPGYVHF